ARVLSDMEQGGQVAHTVRYASNQLEIMVRAGNPRRIQSLRDLAAPGVRLSMPNPEWEGVARQIAASLERSGGPQLLQAVMQTKVRQGSTLLTQIHHRQTPMRILAGTADAGVTWASEVRFQEKIGNPIAGVAIPAADNTTAIYAAGALRDAPHPEAARAWLDFLLSDEAQAIYRKYGFGPAGSAADQRGKP
ncbi:MAG: substrate-binding domain-containing protein, partial [Acidobacteriota bacterium]|nr:substrate-binding domain-containing protein [Acidobacteriota bacterium]